MNQPSADKFISKVVSGGLVLIDATLVPHIPQRDDVRIFAIPSTKLAEENGFKTLSNVILTGKLFAETHFCEEESLYAALTKIIPPKRRNCWNPTRRRLHWA